MAKGTRVRSGEAGWLSVQIPLAKFPPGRYWMQVNVLDPAADRAAFSRLPIAMMRTSAGSSAARAGN